MSDTIDIAEQFYSIQGEGPHAGTPSVFLRLAGCNLKCGMTESPVSEFEPGQEPEEGADWVCDTIDVWREPQRRAEPEELVRDWEGQGWNESLRDGAHLVLTGGEPMLPSHQAAFLSLYGELLRNDVVPFVEVETNGTIEPEPRIWPYVNQWNVSMKLSNSGMDEDVRLNEEAIEYFISVHDDEDRDATFKFVVANEGDVSEIIDIMQQFGIPDSMMMLMPAGQRGEQLRETYPIVAEACKSRGWQFSPRLQVDIWGEVTGV